MGASSILWYIRCLLSIYHMLGGVLGIEASLVNPV